MSKPETQLRSAGRSSRLSLIAVGVGNTSVQIGCFDRVVPGQLPVPRTHRLFSSRPTDWDCLSEAVLSSVAADTPWYIASVFRQASDAVSGWVERRFSTARVRRLQNAEFPIGLQVDAPDQVGTDRVAAATAVNLLRPPSSPAIFVDAGTAITVNAVNARGEFLGGAILPGTSSSGRALADFTSQLPQVEVDMNHVPETAIGRHTSAAIQSGIYWGSVGAARELVDRCAQELGDNLPALFVTGGFGLALSSHLGRGAQYIPHLVLSGIAMAGSCHQLRTD